MSLRSRLEHYCKEAEYDLSKGRESLRAQWEQHFWLSIEHSEFNAWRKANPFGDESEWLRARR